jgi:hypothetical protein
VADVGNVGKETGTTEGGNADGAGFPALIPSEGDEAFLEVEVVEAEGEEGGDAGAGAVEHFSLKAGDASHAGEEVGGFFMGKPYGDVAMGVDLGKGEGVGKDFDGENFLMVEFEGVEGLPDGLGVELFNGGKVGEIGLEVPASMMEAGNTIADYPSGVLVPRGLGMAGTALGIFELLEGLGVDVWIHGWTIIGCKVG